MSKEELISFWKKEPRPGKKPADPLASPKNQPGQAPANPAGEQELSDDDLELVEGGMLDQSTKVVLCSCGNNSCNDKA